MQHLYHSQNSVEKLQEFGLTLHVRPCPLDDESDLSIDEWYDKWWEVYERLPEVAWVAPLRSDIMRFIE